MRDITIYSKMLCPYCARAKALLKRKGAVYEDIDISLDSTARSAMIERAAGAHTVPQIFIGTRHIGGCDDLYALEDAGDLDRLLAG